MKWEDVIIGKSGIKCLEFPLSDEPRFGVWSIFVTEKVISVKLILQQLHHMMSLQINRGTCGYYSSSRGETCRFEVKEFGKNKVVLDFIVIMSSYSFAKIFCAAEWS